MKDDRMAYPTVYNLNQTKSELTKLELISAMCLQGIVMTHYRRERSYVTGIATIHCEDAIKYAKELLKQLEADNDNS